MTKTIVKFNKAKILKMQRYAGRVDALTVLLKDQAYSLAEVDTILKGFMKGKVK